MYSRIVLAAVLLCSSAHGQPSQIHQISYGYNAFMGKTAAEQRDDHIGEQLFTISEENTNWHQAPTCVMQEQSSDVFWGTSESWLKNEASQSSIGADMETTIGAEVPVGPGTVSAETTIRNALVMGSSSSAEENSANVEQGRTFNFGSKSVFQMFTGSVEYDKMGSSWTNDFLNGCNQLGQAPTNAAILQFFKEYGTHGLAAAAFGQECMSNIFMESGYSYSAYSNFRASSSSYEAAMYWWSASSSQSQSEYQDRSTEYGFEYVVANRKCVGDVATSQSYCGGMPGTRNSPAIIKWSYKPIWEMDVPSLSTGAKNAMRRVVSELLSAAVKCSEDYCYGNGACAPNSNWWITNNSNDFSDAYLDSTKSPCFCADGHEGKYCQGFSAFTTAGKSQAFTRWFSEEAPNSSGVQTAPIVGMQCSGGNCDDKRLITVRAGDAKPVKVSTKETAWFSEEGGGAGECPRGTIVNDVQCSGSRCDNVKLYCGELQSDYRVKPDDIRYSAWFSEEEGEGRCPNGYYLLGVSCRGSKCDDLRLKCVKIEFVDPSAAPSLVSSPFVLYTTSGKSQEYKSWFSEENGGLSGRQTAPIVGMKCQNSHCDNKQLIVVRDKGGNSAPLQSSSYWTHWFSEEGGGSANCPTNMLVNQIQCGGSKCDNLRLQCGGLAADYQVHTNDIRYTGWFSEDLGGGIGRCEDGYYLWGVACRGSKCDDLQLRCARVEYQK